METLNDELWDNDHGWEQSAKVKRTVMVTIAPYIEVLKERKGNLNSQHCMLSSKKGRSSTTGLTVALTKTFCLDFEHIKKKKFFYFMKFSYFVLHLTDLYS